MPRTKRPFGVLIAVLGVIMAAVALAGPANAAGYSNQTTSSVSDQTPAAGGTFTASGTGFNAGESVTIRLSGGATLGTATANSSGAFSMSVTLPAGVSGAQTLLFTGVTSGKTSSTSIVVGASSLSAAGSSTPASGSSSLAFTGAAVIAIGSLAVLLVVGGGLMMLAGRRRKLIS